MEHLHSELLERARADQQARARWQPGDPGWQEVRDIDADNTRWLENVIAEYGWPGHSLVGHDGAHAAWLLAQHADLDHQLPWLRLLQQAVEQGDADQSDLAYLHDRVRIRQGQPQYYGTQWGGLEPDATRLFPLAEPDQVNARRAAVGLPAIEPAQLAHAWRSEDLPWNSTGSS